MIQENAYAIKKKENKGCCRINCGSLLKADGDWLKSVDAFIRTPFPKGVGQVETRPAITNFANSFSVY